MPVIGSYSVPGPSSSSTFTEEYSLVDDLLVQLPDNTSNLIVAQDIRDSVYTLWRRIDNVQAIATTAASASGANLFSYGTASFFTVGGIVAGSSFSNASMQQMWQDLLYPITAPSASIFASNPIQQFGDYSTVQLLWSVTKYNYPIFQLLIDPVSSPSNPQPITGGSQVNVVANGTPTYSSSPMSPVEYQIFTMSVTDGITGTVIATASVSYMNRLYWGTIDLSSVGNPNLTLNPGSASLASSVATDPVIHALNGANANGQVFGNELAPSKSKSYLGMDGAGQHLIFAWPSTVADSLTPKFYVNGMLSTAFSQIRTLSSFANELGFTGVTYEVWISNTIQYSPLDIIIV